MQEDQTGPLRGMRVVEFAEGIPGPYCGKLLADLGAEVFKVEPPEGDRTRRWGPFPANTPDPDRSGMFCYLNSGKRGARREELEGLLPESDVFLHDLRPGHAAQQGIGFDGLQARHPGIIVTAITPYGQTGPEAETPATELTVYHRSGMAFDTPQGGVEDLALPPIRPGGWQAQFLSGIVAATGTMMAVTARELDGRGQLVDISELEALTSVMMRINLHQFTYEGKPGDRLRPMARALNVLPCKDGYVNISLVQPHWWNNLVHAMGDPEWATEPLFQDPAFRGGAWDSLQPLIEHWASEYTRSQLFALLQAAHVPCLPGNSFADVLQDPHLKERGFFVDLDGIRMPGAPYRFSRTPWRVQGRAPRLADAGLGALTQPGHTRPAAPEGTGTSDGVETGSGGRPAAAAGPAMPKVQGGRLPLSGIRVVDFTWVFGGPTCCLLLAAMGADVIKVESVLRPDTTRGQRGYREGRPEQPTGGGFDNLNFSKRAVTLNLKLPAAQDLARRLIAQSDAVVENYAAGVMDRLGLGYMALREVNPSLVMLSMSLFGATGPYRKYFGFGGPLPVFTGLASITGYPGTAPRTVGASWPDPLNGVSATLAVLAALHHRRRTGEGQHIDLSMAEGSIATLPWGILQYEMHQRVLEPEVNRDPFMAPHGAYRCRGEDAWIAIAVETEGQWGALSQAAGHPEWATDPRFSTLDGRKEHEDILDRLIEGWTAGWDKFELTRLLTEAGVPAAPSQDRAEVLVDRQLTARSGFLSMPDTAGSTMHPIPGVPWKLHPAGATPRYEKPPRLGEYNDEVFGDLLGLGADEVEGLKGDQVIY